MLVLGALSGCGGSHGAGRAARIDPHPMPADTLIMPAREIGHYGGRFVMAVTGEPKTFFASPHEERTKRFLEKIL